MRQLGGPRIGVKQEQTKRNDASALYKGWLNVERSMFADIDSYVTERLLVFSGGWLEVRKLRWTQPVEVIWSTEKRCYLLSMALNGRETATAVTDLKTGERHRVESDSRMIMVPPTRVLRCSSESGQVRSLRCVLDAQLVESFLNSIPMWDWDQVSLHRTHRLSGGQIEWLTDRKCPFLADGAPRKRRANASAATLGKRHGG